MLMGYIIGSVVASWDKFNMAGHMSIWDELLHIMFLQAGAKGGTVTEVKGFHASQSDTGMKCQSLIAQRHKHIWSDTTHQVDCQEQQCFVFLPECTDASRLSSK